MTETQTEQIPTTTSHIISRPRIKIAKKLDAYYNDDFTTYTINSLLDTIKNNKKTYYEYFEKNQKTKLYFDYDEKLDTLPDNDYLDTCNTNNIEKILYGFPRLEHSQIGIAQRHRWVDNKYKISFRYYIQGYKCCHYKIGDINKKVLGNHFDPQAYRKGVSKLGLVFCSKKDGDDAVLTPMTHLNTPDIFVAQHLLGDEIDVGDWLANGVFATQEQEQKNIAKQKKTEELEKERQEKFDRRERELDEKREQKKEQKILVKEIAKQEKKQEKEGEILGRFIKEEKSWNIDLDDMLDIIYKGLKDIGDISSKFKPPLDSENPNILYFQNDTSRTCVHGDIHINNNSIVKIYGKGAITQLCFGCQSKGEKLLCRWKDSSLSEEQQRLFEIAKKGGTDFGMANLCAELMRNDVVYIYNPKIRGFYYWCEETKLWEVAQDSKVKWLMCKFINDFIEDLERTTGESMLHICSDLALACVNVKMAKHLNNYFSLFYELIKNNEFENNLNSKRELIPFPDGRVLDIRTNTLRMRTKEDMFSWTFAVDYPDDPNTTEMYNLFLEVMSDDPEMTDKLLRDYGYGISGFSNEQILRIENGDGNNGKSLIKELLERVMGNFFYNANPKLLDIKSNINKEEGFWNFRWRRIVCFNELKKEMVLETDALKKLCGDELPVRNHYENSKNIANYILPIIPTNKIPPLEGEYAIIRRVQITPYTTIFKEMKGQPNTPTEKQVDMDLKDKVINTYLPQMVRLLCDYSHKWYINRDLKTNVPAKITDRTKEYFDDNDILQQYINECYDKGDGITDMEYRTKSVSFYHGFREFSGQVITINQLTKDMKQLKYVKEPRMRFRDGTQTTGYFNIKLKTDIYDDEENILSVI